MAKRSTTEWKIRRLRRNELPADTIKLARFLLGKTLVRELQAGRLTGRIVETEAYLSDDAACHAYRGPTPRNRSLFLEHGHAYVYFIYGSSFMMNVSGEEHGVGAGVLLRAIEPIEGLELMRRHRRTEKVLDLARGPGRLASALRIDHRLDGQDLCAPGPIWLGSAMRRRGPIGESRRIGITHDAHLILRFYERGNPFVSGPRKLQA